MKYKENLFIINALIILAFVIYLVAMTIAYFHASNNLMYNYLWMAGLSLGMLSCFLIVEIYNNSKKIDKILSSRKRKK